MDNGPDDYCAGCSSFTDNVGHLAHLNARDTTYVVVSNMPMPQIGAYKQRMGWTYFTTSRGVDRLGFEVIKARGDFHRMADRSARRDATALSPGDLVAAMRDNARHPWKPPGGGFEGALSHDVIHGLDVTVPLGVDRQVPLERISIVLGGLKPKNVSYFGAELPAGQLQGERSMQFTRM
jgi:hypothetical protein